MDAPGEPPHEPASRLRVGTMVWVAVLFVAVLLLLRLSGPNSPLQPQADSPLRFADASGEFAVMSENLQNTSGTDAEAALDEISGGIAEYASFDGVCSDDTAIACVFLGRSTVYVEAEFAQMSDSELARETGQRWDDVMQHEFMHVLQGKIGRGQGGDDELRAMFDEIPTDDEYYADADWPVELEAECMAEVRYPGYRRGYPGSCDAAQLEFARRTLDTATTSGAR